MVQMGSNMNRKLKAAKTSAGGKLRTTLRCVVAVCALAAGLSFSSVQAPPAVAYCKNGSWTWVFLDWGRERSQNSATCNNDGIYAGEVGDFLNDGSCVWVQFIEWGTGTYTQQTSCSTTTWASYLWYDQTGNTDALIRLCRNQGCTTAEVTNGY